jgi:hypothetical protein
MPDEIAKLRTELQILDGRIQAERNDEVRHGLQRGRLEAERAQLLVKMMEATAHTAPPAVSTVGPTSPWRVTLQMPTPDNVSQPLPKQPAHTPADARRKHKPDGLPSITAMITAVLKETPGLRPAEIADLIRKQWWPDLQTPTISTTAWRMVRSGHLTQQDGRYALNGAGSRQNGSGHSVSVAREVA